MHAAAPFPHRGVFPIRKPSERSRIVAAPGSHPASPPPLGGASCLKGFSPLPRHRAVLPGTCGQAGGGTQATPAAIARECKHSTCQTHSNPEIELPELLEGLGGGGCGTHARTRPPATSPPLDAPPHPPPTRRPPPLTHHHLHSMHSYKTHMPCQITTSTLFENALHHRTPTCSRRVLLLAETPPFLCRAVAAGISSHPSPSEPWDGRPANYSSRAYVCRPASGAASGLTCCLAATAALAAAAVSLLFCRASICVVVPFRNDNSVEEREPDLALVQSSCSAGVRCL